MNMLNIFSRRRSTGLINGLHPDKDMGSKLCPEFCFDRIQSLELILEMIPGPDQKKLETLENFTKG